MDATSIHKSDDKLAGNLQHLLSLSASCALAAAISLHSFATPPAQAITTEQLLFLEAWRAVDRAYVDKTFNNQSWFKVKITRSLQACCCISFLVELNCRCYHSSGSSISRMSQCMTALRHTQPSANQSRRSMTLSHACWSRADIQL